MILVVGGTGMLGGMIARRLLVNGEKVRVLVRPQSAYRPLIDAGAEPVFGDLKDRDSLDSAVQGIATVITTANSALRGGDDTPQTVDLEGNRNLIDAAHAAGVMQFIFVSMLAADANSSVPFIQAKVRTEEYLRQSDLTFTILAPNAYIDVWVAMVIGRPVLMGEPVTLVGEGRRIHSFVAADDVATIAVAVIGHPAAMNRRIVIGGPQPLSWRDASATYERVLGHPVEIRTVPPGDQIPGLPSFMSAMLPAFETFDSPIDMTDTAKMFGVRLTPLDEIVRARS